MGILGDQDSVVQIEKQEPMQSLDRNEDVARFIKAAQRYCAFVDAWEGSAEEKMRSLNLLLADLQCAALGLPEVQPNPPRDDDLSSFDSDAREKLRAKLTDLPVKNYLLVFDPFAEQPYDEEPCRSSALGRY